MSSDFTKQLLQAIAGNPNAQFSVAEAYRTGEGTAKNLAESIRWYRAAAEQGHPPAQNNLGSMLLNGMGAGKSPKETAHWYRTAAEQGEACAQFNLALRYLHGSGVEQSDAEAVRWLEEAAKQGYTEAIGQLGTLFRLGQGVPRNVVTAAELHTIAALEGDATSIGNLSDYRKDIEQAGLRGSVVAALCLAKMYDRGLAVGSDPAQVYAWLKWAKRHGKTDNDAAALKELDDMDAFYSACASESDVKRGRNLLIEMAHSAGKTSGISGARHQAPACKAPKGGNSPPPLRRGMTNWGTSHEPALDGGWAASAGDPSWPDKPCGGGRSDDSTALQDHFIVIPGCQKLDYNSHRESHLMTLPEAILAYAHTLPEGGVLSPKEFLHLGSRSAVDQALSRLAKEGSLLRVGRGTYVAPVSGRFGTRPPSTGRVVESLASHCGEIVAPHGAAAANALGLTRQVPAREIYVTSGRTRKLQLGRSEVLIKHVPIWMLALGAGPAGSAVRALAWLGPDKARGAVAKLHRTLPSREWRALTASRAGLPSWMARAIGEEASLG